MDVPLLFCPKADQLALLDQSKAEDGWSPGLNSTVAHLLTNNIGLGEQ